MNPIPKLWPGETVVCIGGGPSLTPDDVDFVRGKARVIAINNAYQLAPWADVLYACDDKWWRWHKGVADFEGLTYSMKQAARRWNPKVQIVRNAGESGLELNPGRGLKTGRNSGYQAINLAVHFGARRILLLGYDMRGGAKHWFGEHPDRSKPPFSSCIRLFQTLVKPLNALGIEVVNCTPGTSLQCFPQMPLAEALPERREAVA